MTDASRIKVKRDGPRGWHWIASASFDPSRHERVDGEQPAAPDPIATAQAGPAPRGRGRPRKNPA